MDEIKDGGPAFPSTNELRQQVGEVIFGTSGHAGMTLRDYFAAKAMQTILETDGGKANEAIASLSYLMADAMLHAREAQ